MPLFQHLKRRFTRLFTPSDNAPDTPAADNQDVNPSQAGSEQLANNERRKLIGGVVAGSGLAALAMSQKASAHALPKPEVAPEDWFPGDPPLYGMVYQLNQSDPDYHEHVINSVGAMVAQYQGRVHLVVVCFGRGIHVLAKEPERPVSGYIRDKVESLSKQGIEFHACGRTMDSLGWTKDDMLPFAKVVQVGASSIMELQLKNYAYLAW